MAAKSDESQLWLLQERLKQERLFVTKEKEAINVLNSEVQGTCEKLFHISWITSQQWRNVGRLQAYPSRSSYATSLLDSARFVDAYKSLGYLESKYGEFLKALRENPKLMASTLAFADNINMDMKQVVRLLLNSLYGNCLLPEDENYALILMKSLIELQILKSEKPREFFRSPRNWSFTVVFGVLVESLFSAKLYLTASLHTQILQVLAQDSVIQAKLAYICTRFVQSLEEKLYCFPPSLRWLVCQLYNTLKFKGNLSEMESKAMVAELIFNYFICPAIINPEPYGINSDMQVSKVARLNLQQISSLLCKRCTSPWLGKHNFTEDMFASLDTHCISSFVDAILRGAEHVQDFPAQHTLPGLTCNSVLITENEMRALMAFLKMVRYWEGPIDDIDKDELQEVLALLPPEPKGTPSAPTYPPKPEHTSPRGSPIMPHKHKRTGFRKLKGKHATPTDNVSQDEEEFEKKTAVSLLTTVVPVISKSQGYQQECLKRLGELFQEDESVLVVPLGYSAVDPPGMLPEDKVLGINKPTPVKKERLKSKSSSEQEPFRSRSSSNKFTELFSKMSVEKELNKVESESSDNEIETSGEHSHQPGLDPVPPPLPSRPLQPIQPTSMLSPLQPQPVQMLQTQKLDLVQSTNDSQPPLPPRGHPPLLGPDVLDSGPPGSGQGGALVDLIDFGGITIPTCTAPTPSTNTFSLLDHPASLDHPPLLDTPITRSGSNSSASSAFRDSTISTGSSARYSTLSSGSGGRESLMDSGFIDIIEESPRATVAYRSSSVSETSTEVDRRSIISSASRDSISSGTTVGRSPSNRDSQASTLSAELQDERQRSGSSSSQENELDLREGKKPGKKDSIKRMIRKKAPSLGFAEHKARKGKEERRRSSPDIEVQHAKDGKKKKGLLRGLRAKRDRTVSGSRTKESNNKVYQVIDDEGVDIIAKPPSLPPGQVQVADERTPKDIIDDLLRKYQEIGTKMAESTSDDGDDEDDEDEEEEDVLDESDRFNDTKRKLRLVLCQADFRNLPWLMSDERIVSHRKSFTTDSKELMTFLHVQLAEAINLQNRSLAAQLHETIRSVRQLPEHSCSKLLTSIEEDYKARMPYLAYLTRSRQALLTTQAHLERLLDRVQRNKLICKKCFISNCVTLFLEAREKEINTFINGFRNNCPTPDEKCKFVEQFLEKFYTELDQDEVWLGMSDDHREEGYIAIERDIMGRIYSFAFYPNGDIDVQRDKTFTQHVERLQGIVGINHKAVRIRKMYRKEAPWPSAQQELSTINAYKTPTDKLKCVQRCCFTIMNLLNMACASGQCEPAGADDFVPALVCVVIQANPPSLLSTIQYVSNFYGQRLSGEEAWSWMQFCAAVEYAKTIKV